MRNITPLFIICFWLSGMVCSCKKSSAPEPVVVQPVSPLLLRSVNLNGQLAGVSDYNILVNPIIKFSFNAPVNKSTLSNKISFKNKSGSEVAYLVDYEKSDSTVIIKPSIPLDYISKYNVSISSGIKSTAGGSLSAAANAEFVTQLDSSRKFPAISENALLDSVQRRTFNYFWKLAHPVSGMARERNTDAGIYTSGGTGFGIMAIVAAIHRNFITRSEGLTRLQTMVSFLNNTAETFHGAYPHWMNGQTGKVIPFSIKDNGADIVETSYLVQGLLTARQYFSGNIPAETDLRNDINSIVNKVEWDWFRQNNQNVLYWHWSPTFNWDMNLPVKGWNESLITYILGASSTTHAIPKLVYDNGWASNGGMKNGKTFYGYTLPLGPDWGGPLFFSHYSFLGVDPNGLTDLYADYTAQVKNHTLINYTYCKTNPQNYFGYSDSVWGLTASDIENGYNASSPASDLSFIAPTAALSSFPYTPRESMQALKFYYYVLGDKIWKEYGFTDAFSLHKTWFSDSYLAIDQGPIMVMIENYRSGLLWNLFSSCPEVKAGMIGLGFSAPYL